MAGDAGPGRPWRGLAGIGALMALAACAAQPLPPPLAAEVGAVDPAAESTADVAVDSSVPASAPDSAPSPDTDAPQVAAAPPAAREPARLMGRTREVLQDILGPAVFIRRDGPVQIWRYAGDDCFLDVFLFRESDAFRVQHLEARPKSGSGSVAVSSCYGRLLERRNGRSG